MFMVSRYTFEAEIFANKDKQSILAWGKTNILGVEKCSPFSSLMGLNVPKLEPREKVGKIFESHY